MGSTSLYHNTYVVCLLYNIIINRQATDSVDVVNKKSKKEVENNDEDDDELALLTQYQNGECHVTNHVIFSAPL